MLIGEEVFLEIAAKNMKKSQRRSIFDHVIAGGGDGRPRTAANALHYCPASSGLSAAERWVQLTMERWRAGDVGGGAQREIL